ncbi:MAG: serine hydrolase [Anaerolineales bacterium]|nr:serine hydrolase [Anaerolineales bacterium]
MKQIMDNFSKFVVEQMETWKVPGLALVVVKDNDVILAKGFGLRDVEQNLPVTPDTCFAIGSATKAFTTMALGILADEGLLEWDKPVRDYLLGFKMYDNFATERMTPRDLVTHRSGLPRHDLMWYGSPFSRKELFDRLQYLAPNRDFRTHFHYQNLMYMTAGYLAGRVTGTTFEEVVRERIFQPLEMTSSHFSVDETTNMKDYSLPYAEKDNAIVQVPFRNIDSIGPAGSINSSLTDMVNWLSLHLNKGKFKDRGVISEANMAQMHTPQMVIPSMPGLDIFLKQKDIDHSSYGLGWFIYSFRGHKLVEHGGNIDGFSSLVSFLPNDNMGAVVLTNKESCLLPNALIFDLYERLLGLERTDWCPRLKKEIDALLQARDKAKDQSKIERKTNAPPSHPLEDYVGEYQHPGYGNLSILLKENHLTARYNSMDMSLDHYHYDTFEMAYDLEEIVLKISFRTDAKGNISQLAIPFEAEVEDIVLTRVASPAMRQHDFLEPFTGAYEVLGETMTVSFKRDDALSVILMGQPEQELDPYRGTTFKLKEQPNISIEFVQDELGTILEAIISQPGAVFNAKRIEDNQS